MRTLHHIHIRSHYTSTHINVPNDDDDNNKLIFISFNDITSIRDDNTTATLNHLPNFSLTSPDPITTITSPLPHHHFATTTSLSQHHHLITSP